MSVRLLATAHDALGCIEAEKDSFLKTTYYFATEIFMTQSLYDLLSEYCKRNIVLHPTAEGMKKISGLTIHVTEGDGMKFWLGVDKAFREIRPLGE